MLLKNARLIPELSAAETEGLYDVELNGGKISAVLPAGQPGEGIDCGGKTLLPGLIDLHTHVSGLRGFDANDLINPMKALVLCAELSQKYLDYGFTTIRDCGSLGRAANHVRDLFARGIADGPTIIACGKILTPTEEEEADPIRDMYVTGDSPWELRKAVRREMAEKADFIKIMASGSAFDPHGIPVQPVFEREELQAIVAAAALKDTYVAAHAHSDTAIRMCIEEGVRTIEHASYLSGETLDLLLKTENCWLVPTLAAMYVSHPEAADGSFWIRRLGELLDICAVNIRRAYEAGCILGFGTDSTVTMDQYEQGIEFRYRKELCGMKDIDILMQATKYSAMIAGISDCVGTVAPGLDADLILVDGKPDADISAMYHKPDMVWKRGKLVRGEA